MGNPRYRTIAIVASLVLVGFVAFAVVDAQRHPTPKFPAVPQPSALRDGARAPTFALSRLGGGAPVAFTGHDGGPVVLNFFASWCSNCVAELNAFSAVAKHPGQAHFVGVDSSDPAPTDALRLLRAAGISYPVGVDGSATVADRYLVNALPVTFFIAPNGTIRGEIFGAASTAQLRSWLAVLGSSR